MFKLIIFCLVVSSCQTLDARSRRTNNNSGMMGIKMYPYLANFKGFDKTTTGLQLSMEDRSGKRGQESVNSFNLYYVKPELKSFPTYKVKQTKFEYENRSYDSAFSYYSAAIGVQKVSPNLGLKNFYSNKNEDARAHIKPYLTFRMGYKIWQKVPVFNTPAIGELSYTLSDDYRFPSPGPHGYQKIPLKGFGAAISFRF